jgi:phenylalanyl-tRNA synthetase beta chain
VARVHGYDRIPERMRVHAASAVADSPEIVAAERARRILLGLGLTEVVTPGLVEAAREGAFADASGFFAPPVSVRNPLSSDRDALRGGLLPSLVQVLATNRSRSTSDLAIFEVSRAYAPRPGGTVDERLRAAILLSGRGRAADRVLEDKCCDFFDIKGLVEVYVEQFWGAFLELGGDDVPALLRPGVSAAALVAGRRVGFLGEAGVDLRRAWDLPPDLPVFLAELDLAARERTEGPRAYRALPRFPGATRDLAVVAPPGVRHGEIAGTIGRAAGELLEACRLFDVYEGAPLAPGERSLAFTLVFRAPERSLTNEEVDARIAAIVEAVRQRHGARIR